MDAKALTYIANGRLFRKDPKAASDSQEITSKFAEDLKERMLQIKRQHEWKTQGRGGQFMGGGGMLWGAQNGNPSNLQANISSITAGASSTELFYTLQADDVAGIFKFDTASGEETRLSHSTEHIVHSAHYSPEAAKLVCSISGDGGLQNLALYDPNRGGFRELTEGDSLDSSPRWVPGESEKIVYQSSGIGRNRDGIWVDTAAATIEQLDLSTGEIVTLAEVPGSDLLAPQLSTTGDLYCIRRPHTPLQQRSLGRTLLEILLVPFHLLGAVFGFLNVFSTMFSGKPLMTSGGPEQEGPDPKQLFLYGKLVDAEQARIAASKKGETLPSIVPRSWELVRFTGNFEKPEVIAKGIIAFNIDETGSIHYSNGSAIFEIDSRGKSKVVSKITDVEYLIRHSIPTNAPSSKDV